MYHHHQQQGSQPFSSGPRPPPNQQQVRPPTDMPPVGGFQFPRPTQLPDELESALSIRGSRDMDHRLIEHLGRLKHQNQASTPGMGQHGNYRTNLCEAQPNQQGVDWSNYEPPTKLFASHPPSAAHQGQHQAGHAGTSLTNWNPPANDSAAPNQRVVEGGRGFYTPESAGTILASFGLSNEDLEALSHYPDDQLTPDTLPFILRDLQIHKTGKPKTERSCSPEVPSLLTVTQTEGRVIDYGHSSQAKEETGQKETFKKEPLSTERTVKMYLTTSAPKLESSERRHVRLEPAESIKHGDRDYRRRSSEHHTSRSPPPRKFSTSTKPQHQDRDYRQERPKPRPSAEKRSEESSLSKQHTSSGSKPRSGGSSSSKKLPTPAMISDFTGLSPKVFPHTCSLCDMLCDQEKGWVEHLETVNHTAACRHLRTKYPAWKPKLPSLSRSDHGNWTKKRPAGHSASRSASWSPSPPPGKHRAFSYRPWGKAYAPHHVSRHHPYKDFGSRDERPLSHGGFSLHRPTSRQHWDKREHGSFRPTVKRPHADLSRRVTGPKGEHLMKRPALTKSKSSVKSGNWTRQSEEGPPIKKKKLIGPGPDCLVYLSDIAKEATEQDVINLASSFGPVNNVLLLPCSDEEDEKEHGLLASVCMMKPEDAQNFANSPNLLIRDKVITASLVKTPEEELSSDDGSSKSEQQKDTGTEGGQMSGKEGVVLIEGLPESGWSEEDLRKMAEPFGYPIDVILAKQIRKALLIMPDVETAQEMEKVLSFSPATINEHKLKIKHIKKDISLHTPVALYNLLMQSSEGGKTTKAMSWTMLIVVSNLPPTPSSASVVQKIVSRIGTVLRTLAVNDTVICEMATGQLATAAYKHYLKFPCIIQNNPLVFSRKPDPKPALTKVIPAFLDADKEAPDNKKDVSKSAETTQKKSIVPNTEPQVEKIKDGEMKKDQAEEAVDEKDVEEEKNPGEETTHQQTKKTVDAEPKPEAEGKTKTTDQSGADVAMEAEADVKTSDATENGANVPGGEEADAAVAPEGEADKVEEGATKAEAPKAVSAEREAPVKPQKPAGPRQKQTSMERSKNPLKNTNNFREEEKRWLERDRKERESWERERRDWDRIRMERDYEERAKRDRRGDPRREAIRREWERRDRERKEWEWREGRKRSYGEVDRRSDSSKRSYWREERHKSSAERSEVDEEEFPFNLSDFVTVDEVGDDEVGDVDTSDVSKPEGTTDMTEMGQESSEPPQKPPQERQEPDGEVASMEVTSEAATKTEDTAVKDPDGKPVDTLPTEKETISTVVAEEETSVAEEEKFVAEEETSVAEDEKLVAEEETSVAEVEKLVAEEDRSFAEEEKSVAEEEKLVAEEETSVAENEKLVAEEETSVAEDEKLVAEEETSVAEEEKLVAEEETSVAEEEKLVAEEETSVAEDEKLVAEEETSVAEEEKLVAEEERSVAEEEKSVAEEEKFVAEEEKSVAEEETPVAEDSATVPSKAVSPAETKTEQDAPQDVPNAPQQDTSEVSDSAVKKEVAVEVEEAAAVKEEAKKETPQTDTKSSSPDAVTVKSEIPEKASKESLQSNSSRLHLPPFDPNNAVGMEYLVPMTGFFCKVCTRFFTGTKDTEISHSKTFKHYENLETFLKTRKVLPTSTSSKDGST